MTEAFGLVKSLSSDAIFLIVVFGLFFVFTLYLGKGRMTSLAISFYPTVILFNSFPFLSNLIVLHGVQLIVINKIIVFLLFLIPVNIILDKYIFSEMESAGSSHIFRVVGLALSGVILVMIFSYSVVNFDSLHDFSTGIDNIFGSTNMIFYWNLVPLAILAIL
jgi:hypothetical protein